MSPDGTTHRACPVDGAPCWGMRAWTGCPHIRDDGVRECVRRAVGELEHEHADLWAAMGKE